MENKTKNKIKTEKVDTKDDRIAINTIKENLYPNCTFKPHQLYKAAKPLIRLAIKEDIPQPHLVDARLIMGNEKTKKKAAVIAKEEGILSGGFLIYQTSLHYNPKIDVKILRKDGERIHPEDVVAELEGPVVDILVAERVILNFIARMSGIATLTWRCVRACEGTEAIITDTRKTLPGYRILDKYAVQCGGGVNHRLGLCNGIMIKDNHISALKNKTTLKSLVRKVKERLCSMNKSLPIWIEIDRITQLPEALDAQPDIILLDNMSPEDLKKAVKIRDEWFLKNIKPKRPDIERPIPLLEASGGIEPHNIADFAKTGVERISIGAITHSAPALDFTLELVD